MFKKSLAAAAILGAFVGSAFAADVTLYGLVDYGFSYQNKSPVAGKDTDSFQMKSGQNSGSRFGLKGEEDLGNGLAVGFVLENGFDADTGALGNGGRLFGRESQAYIKGDFGTVSFGRMGQLVSGNGTYGLFGSAVSPFSTGWGDVGGHSQVMGSSFERFDNMITYKTPDFGGFTVYAQYSFDNNSLYDAAPTTAGIQHGGSEGKTSVDRYYGIAAQYKAGNLMIVGAVDSMNWAQPEAGKDNLDDSLSVNLAGTYDFGVAKVYAYGQYFQDYKSAGKVIKFENKGGVDGYGINLGVDVPAFGGTAKAAVAYGDFEQTHNSAMDMKTYQVTLGYTYNLSKRTFFYTAADYIKADYAKAYEDANKTAVENVYEVNAGLVHKF